MKKTFLVVAVVTTSLLAVLFSGMALGRDGRDKLERESIAPSLNHFSPQATWEVEIKYVVQWDDASKKLLIDGQAISHETNKPTYDHSAGGSVRGFRFRGAVDLTPASDHPDQYSFDVGTIGNFVGSVESNQHDGLLHYYVHWDDSKKCFVFDESVIPKPEECFQFFVDGNKDISRPVYTSINSPLDLLDSYRLYHR
jgi:hypothetical protein